MKKTRKLEGVYIWGPGVINECLFLFPRWVYNRGTYNRGGTYSGREGGGL